MATRSTKYILTNTLIYGTPGVIVLAALVWSDNLAIGPAFTAGGALLCLTVIWSIRPTTRLRQLQRRLERLVSGDTAQLTEASAETLTDPGGGAIGDLTAAFQRLERNWNRDRKALNDGLASAATLFDAMPDPLVTLDGQARLVYANAAARLLLAGGRPEGDLRGRDLSAVLRQPIALGAVSEVLAGAPTRTVEFTFTDRVDQTFEARVEAIAGTDVGDNEACALLLLHDVTARQRNEQSRADFVANVSHELRTPLTSLIGFIETLRGPAKDDHPAGERFLGLMATQSSRMARLVDDLLSLSRIEMNEHTRPSDPVDLSNVINTVVALLAPQARERNISIQIQLDDLTHPIIGAQDELVQLFQNLIENATKYARKGTIVRVQATVNDDIVTVSVIDEGDGIASEHLARLTERFYRIDTARSRELGGTGLGLAIVKHIVNRHRGDLKIESIEGKGSTFAVALRLAPITNKMPTTAPTD